MSVSENKRDRKPRELLDLDIREVSLVDRPAIRRKFLVIKRDESGDNMSDEQVVASEQESFIFDEVVVPDEEVVKAEQKSEEVEEEAAEEESSKSKAKAKAKAEELEEESVEEEEPSEKKKNKKVKKETKKMDNSQSSIPVSFSKRDDGSYDLTGVPEEMQATVEQLCKAQDAAIQKAAELEEILKAERDERLRRDFVEKAEKEYPNLPGTAVEIGILLKSLNDLDKEVAEKVEGIFKSVNAQIESGSLLEEVGSPTNEAEVTAWGRIEKQAEELITNGVEVSKAAAITKVLELNPKLYSQYLKEGGK